MSRQALNTLAQFREVNLYLRGMVPMVGYRSTSVYYKRGERFAGTSKYPLRKMIALAIDGFMTTNVRPLRMMVGLGSILFVVAFILGIFFVVQWFAGWTVPGWASIIVSIWALGGIQLLSLGIIGEYISNIFLEVKDRPRYIVRELLGDAEAEA